MSGKLIKGAHFGDIHFGKKANSKQHNEDCVNFIKWFCEKVRQDEEIDHVVFLGDWHENRNSIDVQTLSYSLIGAELLNNLGIPIFFLIGNHDLYHRHTRELHSVKFLEKFSNFKLIEKPTVVKDIGQHGALLCPYMFHDEYPQLAKHQSIPYWAGHFEFRGFIVTGYGIEMHSGPDHLDFKGPKHIVSGHFHKRQAKDNVVYIGNTFPMDFGDAGDFSRGMMVYDHRADEMVFYDWEQCPKYVKITLSELLSNPSVLPIDSRVKCTIDIPISFEESTVLRQKFMEDYNLREFAMEEAPEIRQSLTETQVEIQTDDQELASVEQLVVEMLRGIDNEHINSDKLVEIFHQLNKPLTEPNNDSI